MAAQTVGQVLKELSHSQNLSRTAIIFNDQHLSYREFLRQTHLIYGGLKAAGLKKGDVVGIFLADSPELLLAMMAIANLGAVFLGFNLKSSQEEILETIVQSNVQAIITNFRLAAKISGSVSSSAKMILPIESLSGDSSAVVEDWDYQKVDADDTAAIILTSGTMGFSKGLLHSHHNLITVGENCASAWGINSNDRLMSCIPLLSAASLSSIIMPMLVRGGCLIITPERKMEVILKCIEIYQVSFLLGTPTNYIQMLNYLADGGTHDFSSLRGGTIAGAPIPDGLCFQVRKTMGCEIFPHYGMTELFAVTRVLPDGDLNTLGTPFPGIEVQIRNQAGDELSAGAVGEIVCRSTTKAKGYINDAEVAVSLEDDWFHTGDLGIVDEHGNLKIMGRAKNIIIRGGNNIFPEEIETVLLNHAKVFKTAVIGLPDDIHGEKIVALVVLKEHESLSQLELLDFLKGRLLPFKLPQEIVFTKELLATESGKIYRGKLNQFIS